MQFDFIGLVFRSSSNNHINNYQIDLFPIPKNEKKINKLEIFLKKIFFKNKNLKNRNLLENIVLDIYDCLEYKDVLHFNHPKGKEVFYG